MTFNNTTFCNSTKQFLYEIGSWIREMEFLAQEVSHMKNRLSEVLDHIEDREQLVLAEHYQNQFIIKDDLFDHIIHELIGHSKRCKELKSAEFKFQFAEINKSQKKFREQMELIEKAMFVLKKDYNTYIYDVCFPGK